MQIIKLPDGRKYKWFPKADRWEEWDVCDRWWSPYWEETEILERLAKADAALRKAKAETVVFKSKADDLMKRKPPEGVPICEAANDLFNEAIRKNGQ